MTVRQTLAAGLLLLGTLAVVYVPHVRSAALVYEDPNLVEGFDRPPEWGRILTGRGLTYESWTIINTPFASHALNVGLHLLVVRLAGELLWLLTGSVFTAWAVAAIVALHPLTLEGVAYAASRAELISAIGVLLVLVCAVAPSPWTWALIPPAVVLAYVGKETGVIALALLPLAVWFKGDRAWSVRLTALLLSAGLGLALWRWPALQALSHLGENGGSVVVTPGVWIATQTGALARLAVLSVAPFWLSVSPGVRPLATAPMVAALILGAGLLEVTWRLSSRAPLAAFGLVGCALVAAPRFIVRTPGSPFNEHQWYLAMPFVACVLTAGLGARPWRVAWSS